jgi:ABC-type molybdate transport system substrate-binding protein
MVQHQADVFLTYCSSAAAAQKEVPSLNVVQFPPVLQVDARYGLSVRSTAARPAFEFEQALLAPPAQAVLGRYGFAAPQGVADAVQR